MSIYLDYNASAPIDPRVLDYMIDIYKGTIGNPDSRTHDFGDSARKVVENARKSVANILGIRSDEVFFTSGATESNNIIIQGLKEYANESGKKHIITTAIEHKAVLQTVKALGTEGFDVTVVYPDLSGRVSAEDVIKQVRKDTLIVSIMHVNNETGIIQPVIEIGEYLYDKVVFFHIDATQSFGKLVDELRKIKYDMLSMSAHKIYGPQGVGAMVLRKKRYKLPPVKGLMYGGQQEHGIRPGTIPVALVAGLGCACEIASNSYVKNEKHCRKLKTIMTELLEESGVVFQIIGDQNYCVSNTINISFTGVSAEALMISTKKYCGISNGSACNSNSYEPSYVLSAMKMPVDTIDSAVRISWGPSTNEQDFINSMRRLIGSVRELAM